MQTNPTRDLVLHVHVRAPNDMEDDEYVAHLVEHMLDTSMADAVSTVENKVEDTLADSVVHLDIHHVEPVPSWEPFRHEDMPDEGLYWFALSRPEVDVDVSDDRFPIGVMTGDSETVVMLARFTPYNDGTYDMDALDRWSLGEVLDEDIPIAFMRMRDPTPPLAYFMREPVEQSSEESPSHPKSSSMRITP